MMRSTSFAVLVYVTLNVGAVGAQATPSFPTRVAEQLRLRLEMAGTPPRVAIGDEIVYSSTVLPAFYEQRGFRPAWLTERGATPQADSLLKMLREAPNEGLRTADYHYTRMERVVRSIRGAVGTIDYREWADLDLLLTDAFLIYGAHLVGGRLDPLTIQSGWYAVRREVDLQRVLERALDSGTVAQALRDLLPAHRGYHTLRTGLARYRTIEARGGWRSIPAGSTLRPGDRDARIRLLRARLVGAGDLETATAADPELYDAALAEVVRHYQDRHGLEPDGIIGPATIAELNTTVQQRIDRLEVNLERWRWLPQRLGDRHILVNIAAFDMRVIEGEREAVRMRAVVGRPYRMTPVFSDRMTYLVLAPTWTVPERLAVEDKLPLIRRNPAYVRQQRMRVLRKSNMREVDPAAVNWTGLGPRNFPYVLVQDPGPLNALGRAKFMFPNRHNVYLHDTPSQEHFSLAARAFSSGCIRLERPLDLAQYLLREDTAWTRSRIESVSRGTVERMVPLRRPLPVHLLYWTAWAEADGTIHFRPDIYGRDSRVSAGLDTRAPDPSNPPPVVEPSGR